MANKATIYYWPMMARGAAIIRMFDYKGIEYEWVSDKEKMSAVCSTWGASGDTFAPPVLVDGETTISQQVAATIYAAQKCGYRHDAKVMQFCLDIIDIFEGGWGKNNEQGPALKAWAEGDRCKNIMSNLERGIKGPYFMGDELSAADFLLLAHLDWRGSTIFAPLKEKYGVDIMKDYPKMAAIQAQLQAHQTYNKDHKGMGPLKAEILEAYNN